MGGPFPETAKYGNKFEFRSLELVWILFEVPSNIISVMIG